MDLTQRAVEDEIQRLCQRAEDVTSALATRAREAAEADARYKVAHAKAFLAAEGAVATREAEAAVVTADEYQGKKVAEALLLSAQEAGRNCRAQLDSLRSINSNLRGVVA